MGVRNTSLEVVYVEIPDPEPSWRVTRTYPKPRQSPVLTPPIGGTNFFTRMPVALNSGTGTVRTNLTHVQQGTHIQSS
ncbi:hypothetical protein MY3296_010173 [Beauveria thailandica]